MKHENEHDSLVEFNFNEMAFKSSHTTSNEIFTLLQKPSYIGEELIKNSKRFLNPCQKPFNQFNFTERAIQLSNVDSLVILNVVSCFRIFTHIFKSKISFKKSKRKKKVIRT